MLIAHLAACAPDPSELVFGGPDCPAATSEDAVAWSTTSREGPTLAIMEVYAQDDGEGEVDWIELFNYGDEPVDLADVQLEDFDSAEADDVFAFEGALEPEAWFEVPCTRTGSTGFALKDGGQTVALVVGGDTVKDRVGWGPQTAGRSSARVLRDGCPTWVTAEPTRAAPNE
ncbi:MAG: lamin tail domain-containing protein [Myxococcota bacterium]